MIRNKSIVLPEDGYKVKEALEYFSNPLYKRYFSNKDLNQYKTLPDLRQEVNKIKERVMPAEIESKVKVLPDGAELIYNEDPYKIFKLTTPKACEVLTDKTEWCTAHGAADEYLEKGILYAIMKDGKWHSQLFINRHPRFDLRQYNDFDSQYMDVDDIPIKINNDLIKILSQLLNVPELALKLINNNSDYLDAADNTFVENSFENITPEEILSTNNISLILHYAINTDMRFKRWYKLEEYFVDNLENTIELIEYYKQKRDIRKIREMKDKLYNLSYNAVIYAMKWLYGKWPEVSKIIGTDEFNRLLMNLTNY